MFIKKSAVPLALRACILSLAIATLFPSLARAHPYASGVTNAGGTVRFILNESTDGVQILLDGGLVTNHLGALAAGVHSFALGSHTNYAIVVSKVGAGYPTQISSDANPLVNFYSGRGIAVNLNPKTSRFGRIYVINSTPGTSGGRSVGRGLYILNANQSDALGRGNAPSTAGVSFIESANSPYHPGLGPDDSVYVNDWADASATTWMLDPDITVNQLVLAGIGKEANPSVHTESASTPVVRGSLAGGDLVLFNIQGSSYPYNGMARWDIGPGPLPWKSPPVLLGDAGQNTVPGLIADLDIGPDGKFYTSENRYDGTDADSIRVFDTDGLTLLWGSRASLGIPDPLRRAHAIMVSPDGQFLGIEHADSRVSILRLTDGIPDFSSLIQLTNGPFTQYGRDIAWDAANNLYTISSGQELLRVYSLGMTTTAITSNDATGTNGSFQLLLPPATVSVTATTPLASQNYGSPIPGVLTLTRGGQNLNQPLTVAFSLSGTAEADSYAVSPPEATNAITFAANQVATNLSIIPVADNTPRLTTTVVLTLAPGTNYTASAPLAATVSIRNTAPQRLMLAALGAPVIYARFTNDCGPFAILRLGDTNASNYTVSNYLYGGTAVQGTDYVGAPPIIIRRGDVMVTNQIFSPPQPPPAFYGSKTVLIGLGSGGGVYSEATNTCSVTMLGDKNPPAAELYADPLADPNNGTGWNTRFGYSYPFSATNEDYEVTFGYDLTENNPSSFDNGVIPPPPNGQPSALRITCNKSFFAAAGVNVYLTNQVFSGDYGVRFNMNLVRGGSAVTATEGVLFGINHSGTLTNFWVGDSQIWGGPWAGDGLWFWITSDPGGAAHGDFLAYTGNGGTNGTTGSMRLGARTWEAFTDSFRSPSPYSTLNRHGQPTSGVPANGTPAFSSIFYPWYGPNDASTWSDVEINQINNVVSLAVNHTPVFSFTNTTVWRQGVLMLGYCDPFSSVGSTDAAVYFSNLRVVRLGPPVITGISLAGGNVVIEFTTSDGTDAPSSFVLYGSADVFGPMTEVIPHAAVSRLPSGVFRAVTGQAVGNHFYRVIRR